MTSSLQLQYLQDIASAEAAFLKTHGKIERSAAERILAELHLSPEATAFVSGIIEDEFTVRTLGDLARTDGIWGHLQVEALEARQRFGLPKE